MNERLVQADPNVAFLRSQPLLLQDPFGSGALEWLSERELCTAGGLRFQVEGGIPRLYASLGTGSQQAIDQVSEEVQQFYERTPFPNYDELDSRWTLRAKASRGVFAKLLDEQLPDRCLVLEAGCGTGQLSNFLGMSWRRKVVGLDLCLNSLKLAKGFAEANLIRNVAFVQGNLFRAPFPDEAFDVVISNGVLHHTADCEAAFGALMRKLRPGGYALIGLYNAYGRLPTLWKRWVFERFGSSTYFLDGKLRSLRNNPARLKAWFEDQYRHPFETRHSMDEVLRWFSSNAMDFVNSLPHVDGSEFSSDERLFAPRDPGHMPARVSAQMNMLLSGGADGGLFIMIGRKRSS